MRKKMKLTQLILTIIMVTTLFAPLGISRTPARISPQLAALAQQSPNQWIRAIVQKADDSHEAEALVESMGGEITKDLELINGFVAQMPAGTARELATMAAINWVSLDNRMIPANMTIHTVLDEFNTNSYNEDDGTATWSGHWVESDNNSVSNGAIRVTANSSHCLAVGCMKLKTDYGSGQDVYRAADLSGASSATLSYYYEHGLEPGDEIIVEVSSDGGSSYTQLASYTSTSSEPASENLDISAFISSDFRVRIRIAHSSDDGAMWLDNIQVEYASVDDGGGGGDGGDVLATIIDQFDSVAYNGSNGTFNWADHWVEVDNGHIGSGATRVTDSDHCLASNCLKIKTDYGSGQSVYRAAKIDGATSANLSFYYEHSLEHGDNIVVEVSMDGGDSYTPLANYTEASPDDTTASFDLSPYLTSSFRLRFRIDSASGDGDMWIDDIQITGSIDQNHYLDTMGVNDLHAEGLTGQGVTVAVIDSGISTHSDFGGRLISTPEYGTGDLYGHGTHVAGIIAGNGNSSNGAYAGVAPGANLISLGVSDQYGMAYESDVVDAMQWVFENKDVYGISIINLSLNSTVEGSYHESGITAAAEILWHNGVVVVVSVGNNGPAGSYNTTKTAPANDPYLIVAGASDEMGDGDPSNDTQAAFSASGLTLEGIQRPNLMAPGYEIYSTLSLDSDWVNVYPEKLSFGGRNIRLSGTSMAAPMATGVVALLLEDEPQLTPDQIKYRLRDTASLQVGGQDYLDAYAAVHGTTTEGTNEASMPHVLLAKMALIAYWASVNGGDDIDWANVDWVAVHWDSVNWNAVNWNAVNWNAVNWNAVNWNAVNWNAVNWNAVNWNAVNWNAVNWNAVNWNAVNWNAVELGGILLDE
jgi:serine protease AprX